MIQVVGKIIDDTYLSVRPIRCGLYPLILTKNQVFQVLPADVLHNKLQQMLDICMSLIEDRLHLHSSPWGLLVGEIAFCIRTESVDMIKRNYVAHG